MNAITKYFGEINYDSTDVLHAPAGLFGFEERTEYLLIHFKEDDNSILCLQSVEEENLAFVLTSPFLIMPSYRPELTKDDMAALNLTEDSDVTFYAICVIQENLDDSTVNLRCPLVINHATRAMRQVILDNTSFSFKHPLRAKENVGKEATNC